MSSLQETQEVQEDAQPESQAQTQEASQKKSKKPAKQDGEAAQEAEEDIAAKGLCPSVKKILERELASYPTTLAGRKEMSKNIREALRDQMEFEGKQRYVSTLL